MEERDRSAGKKAIKEAHLPAVAIYQYDRRTKQYSVIKDLSNLLPKTHHHGRSNKGTKRSSS
jgi:hypothetical protein